jgi:hypothetical protein
MDERDSACSILERRLGVGAVARLHQAITEDTERDTRIAEARMTEYLERQKRLGP